MCCGAKKNPSLTWTPSWCILCKHNVDARILSIKKIYRGFANSNKGYLQKKKFVSNVLPKSKRRAIFQEINKRENMVKAYQCVALRWNPSIASLGT